MASGANQQTQSLTKPAFTEAQASALVESVFGLKVSKIQPLPSYDDQNFHVYISRTNNTADGPAEYVLKICNTETSKNPDLIEVQNCIIMFLKAAGFPTACVCRTKEGNTTSLVSIDNGSGTKSHLLRLLTFLPGSPVAQTPTSPPLLYEIGRLAATLDKTLETFHHPKLRSLHRDDFIWNLKNVPLLEKYTDAMGQNQNREIVEQVIQLFKKEVVTKLSHFRECSDSLVEMEAALLPSSQHWSEQGPKSGPETPGWVGGWSVLHLLILCKYIYKCSRKTALFLSPEKCFSCSFYLIKMVPTFSSFGKEINLEVMGPTLFLLSHRTSYRSRCILPLKSTCLPPSLPAFTPILSPNHQR
ncbi:hydroxylysine kinase isoform X2 [Cavia porcellus]|uniref:hydroxylysine kinase isoform X2 n=1 Tax=Cavia porcellus TaxID=10141 RepID=UPI002FE07970